MGRKLGLTLEAVLDAAQTRADRDGLDRLTLALVAGDLGIAAPSLYAHVAGLPGLRRLLALRAADLLHDALAASPDLTTAAHAFRGFVQAHPGLYAAMFPAPTQDQDPELYAALARAAGPAVAAVEATGLRGEEAIHATRALRAAVHGFVLLEQGGGFGQPADVGRSFEVLVAVLVHGLTP